METIDELQVFLAKATQDGVWGRLLDRGAAWSIMRQALLVLLGIQLRTELYFETALVIAMLGFVSTVVLSKYVLRGDIVE